MRKLMIVSLLCLLVFSGCASAMDMQTAKLGRYTTIGNWEIVLDSCEFEDEITTESRFFSPSEEGNVFMTFAATVTNGGDESVEFLPMLYNTETEISAFALVDSTEYIPTNLLGYPSSIVATTFEPQETKKGIIVFEVPAKASESDTAIAVQLTLDNTAVVYDVQ